MLFLKYQSYFYYILLSKEIVIDIISEISIHEMRLTHLNKIRL
jgi:hypothetical protein